jgi:hypothetical protein
VAEVTGQPEHPGQSANASNAGDGSHQRPFFEPFQANDRTPASLLTTSVRLTIASPKAVNPLLIRQIQAVVAHGFANFRSEMREPYNQRMPT